MCDIDLADWNVSMGGTAYTDGNGWTPIGDCSNPFDESFDGDHHVIANLTITSSADYTGLFGCIGPDGTVENIGIDGGSIIYGSDYGFVGGVAGINYGMVQYCYNAGKVNGYIVGGVAGANFGMIQYCSNIGDISGSSSIGGVAGSNNSTIQHCYNTGDIASSGIFTFAGGVVGVFYSGTVQYCYNTGSVTSGGDFINDAGGVVGWNEGGTVQYCYNTGDVTGGNAGGVVGENYYTIQYCYNTGNVSSIRDHIYIGGVAGTNGGTVQYCYNTGSVTNSSAYTNNASGVVGYNSLEVTNCYYNSDNCQHGGINNGDVPNSATGLSTADMTNGAPLDGLNAEGGTAFVMPYGTPDGCLTFYPELAVFAINGTDLEKEMSKNSVTVSDCVLGPNEEYFMEGNGTFLHPYLIYTAEQLNHVREHLDSGIYFKLMADIDLSGWNAVPTGEEDTPQNDGNGWEPIGANSTYSFNGTFDGNGFVIKDLTISDSTSAYYVGLFGYIGSDGMVENLGIVGGSVTGNDNSWYVSSVVGYNNGTIINCYNYGCSVVSDEGNYVGGVVGINYGGTIKNCYNASSVNGGDGLSAGGVAGLNSGTIQYCYNTGSVTGGTYSYVGGVVGFNDGEVSYCYNTGSVTGNGYCVSGVVGLNYGPVQYCYNTGSVTASGDHSDASGLVGFNVFGTVQYCYNTGGVSGNYNAGGVVVENYNIVSNCYNAGMINGSDASGVVCYNSGEVSDCYYNIDNYSGNAILDGNGSGDTTGGLTTAQMIHKDVLSGKMSALSGAFCKRDADSQYSYYPELDVFFNGTEQQQTDSQNSVAVEWNTPPAPSVKDYYITATSDSNSSITPGGTVKVQKGDNKTFFFSASPGYSISSVTVDRRSLTQEQIALGQYTFTNLNMNHTIDVAGIYNPDGSITLSINIAQGKGYAEYSFDGGANFTTYVSATAIPPSSNVVIRAYADDGYGFDRWGGASESTMSEISFGGVGTSLHLDLYFTENSAAHGGLLWWTLGLIILTIIILSLIWLILFYGRYCDVIKIGGNAIIMGNERVRRRSEYRFSVEGSSGGKVSYRVGEGGQWKTLSPDTNGEYTIPMGETVDNIAIEVR